MNEEMKLIPCFGSRTLVEFPKQNRNVDKEMKMGENTVVSEEALLACHSIKADGTAFETIRCLIQSSASVSPGAAYTSDAELPYFVLPKGGQDEDGCSYITLALAVTAAVRHERLLNATN